MASEVFSIHKEPASISATAGISISSTISTLHYSKKPILSKDDLLTRAICLCMRIHIHILMTDEYESKSMGRHRYAKQPEKMEIQVIGECFFFM